LTPFKEWGWGNPVLKKTDDAERSSGITEPLFCNSQERERTKSQPQKTDSNPAPYGKSGIRLQLTKKRSLRSLAFTMYGINKSVIKINQMGFY
jgi:hypothetical protein